MNSWLRSRWSLIKRVLSAFTSNTFSSTLASLAPMRSARAANTASRSAWTWARRALCFWASSALITIVLAFFSIASLMRSAFSWSLTFQRARSCRYPSSSCSSDRSSLTSTCLIRTFFSSARRMAFSLPAFSCSSFCFHLFFLSLSIFLSTSCFRFASCSLSMKMCSRNLCLVFARFLAMFSARLRSSMSICSRSRCLSLRSMRPVGILRVVSYTGSSGTSSEGSGFSWSLRSLPTVTMASRSKIQWNRPSFRFGFISSALKRNSWSKSA
mmetsp:Transcript_66110/g.173313  ORF Transcript_66110/g.173313 Transcript_66110/m.173313 type:complete len:270 (+) Transcript_66110:671-1480(+)